MARDLDFVAAVTGLVVIVSILAVAVYVALAGATKIFVFRGLAG